MVILGLVLVLVALLLGAALITGTSAPETIGQDVDIQVLDTVTFTLNPLTLVVAGMAVMLLLWLGLVMIKMTIARKARLRRERKAAEREARERREREETERQLEERRLEEERRRSEDSATHPDGAPTAPGDTTRPVPRQGTADETTPVPLEPRDPNHR